MLPRRCLSFRSAGNHPARLPGASPLRRYSEYNPTRYRPNQSSPSRESRGPEDYIPIQNEFRQGFSQVAAFYGRLFKYSALTAGILAAIIFGGWEGAHQWVEHVELKAPPPQLDDTYEWGREIERWTSPRDGMRGGSGTDPRLGWKGRHAVRAAWMALNWNRGVNSSGIIESSVTAGDATGDARPYTELLHVALAQLAVALKIARSSFASPSPPSGSSSSPISDSKKVPEIDDSTVADLSTLSVGVLLRIGSPKSLLSAQPVLEQLRGYYARTGDVVEEARTLSKLGDVCANLRDSERAMSYWEEAFSVLGVPGAHIRKTSFETRNFTPSAQRLVATLLASMSAHLASSRQFESALQVESNGREIIGRFGLVETPVKADQALHYLYLHHRALLLQMHFAEVAYASTGASKLALSHLQSAAHHSENIVHSLTGPYIPSPSSLVPTSLPSSDTSPAFAFASPSGTEVITDQPFPSPLLPNPTAPLRPDLLASQTLSRPAQTLLRQAKRSAAQSLRLAGVLLELESESLPQLQEEMDVSLSSVFKWGGRKTKASEPDIQNKSIARDQQVRDMRREAMEHYERALTWVGGGPDGHAGDDIPESEWKEIWDRYVKIREKVNVDMGGASAAEDPKV